jgi:hypothetical protein
MAKQISMVRILRDADGDVEDVTVGDSLAEILDVDANITARCDLQQLETVTADDFPEDLILQTSSSDGLETYLFHEIEILSDSGIPSVRFICHHPNKYWEGRWGLATYLGANSETDATHEVIVLARYDAEILRKEVVRQKSSAKTLKEKMLAEMLEEMVSVIEADSQRNAFVFARKL